MYFMRFPYIIVTQYRSLNDVEYRSMHFVEILHLFFKHCHPPSSRLFTGNPMFEQFIKPNLEDNTYTTFYL